MGSEEFRFLVPEEIEGARADKGISDYLDDFSRSRIQSIIKDGKVFINGKKADADDRLKALDEVVMEVPDIVIPDILPEDIPLDILYEDEELLVVNKPKDMVVHPAVGHYSGTLVNALMFYCHDLSGINGILRPGIVHRIDKDTTGALIVCKTDDAHRDIAAQLKEHSIKRLYRAIVCGVIKEDEGTVDAPIGRHPNDRKKMAANVRGAKRAVTHFRVIERFKEHTYIECRLETGRTHQIRVHMALIHHPVMGDEVYSSGRSKYRTDGQVLHAYMSGFKKPKDGSYIEVTAPLPEYFEELLVKLRNR
ncbi:MAG: RluA family pseudouridine synthase [Lachnospiraceae bacterium]|nr:RluA family pseudouridine synthase [Lachnospiraceae bacterium]